MGGRLPILTWGSSRLWLRRSLKGTLAPGLSSAMRSSITWGSFTSLPPTASRMSPGLMPAPSAGLPRSTPAMRAPLASGRPKDSASSAVISWASTPIQPRVTVPVWMICSMMLLAVETGMAKPMPREPPERE